MRLAVLRYRRLQIDPPSNNHHHCLHPYLNFQFPAAIDLSTVSSPHSGSTTGNSNDITVCGGSSDQGFSGVLKPGERITIGQTSNTFDSMHTLRYGGEYPGDHVVACEDDPDDKVLSYTNAGELDVPVYFTVDGHGSSEAGDFSLAWAISDAPGTPPFPPHVKLAEIIQRTSARSIFM